MNYQLSTSNLGVAANDDGSWTLWDTLRGERLLLVPAAPVCRPIFVEFDVDTDTAAFRQLRMEAGAIEWDFDLAGCHNFTARLEVQGDALIFSSRFTPQENHSLTRLELLPPGTSLSLYDVVNFRNRHHTPQTWPELLVGEEDCSTNTYSEDWQFAPHPSLLVFRKGTQHLLFGALDLSPSFGLYFSARHYHSTEFFLDFGASPHALPLQAQSEWSSPRFILLSHEANDVHDTVARYGKELIARRIIPEPESKLRFDWHREPLYFTWVDQYFRSDARLIVELEEQADEMKDASNPLLQVMSEEFVREAAAVIERERLPIRTILLDDGWQVARGQWQPHPDRFPNLRRLVDDLHARDFKVLVWWNWAEILDHAEIEPETLLKDPDGTIWRNRHGARVRDYSHPATQEYLRELFHILFSFDEGCYDLDGVKTDFLADKVHADMPLFDSSWRGEENYMLQVTRLFSDEMRRHKPDACHVGCAGHPYLAQFIDINRTYDVFSSNVEEHVNRARMLKATTPGTPVAFDSHNYIERFDDYFVEAAKHNCSVQISNILGMQQDQFSPWEAADDSFYQLLRDGLAKQDSTFSSKGL